MIEFLEGLMPFRMLWDFLPLLVAFFFGCVIIAVIETFVLKYLKQLEAPKNLFYAILANVLGFLISLILGIILLYVFALFFGGAMAGSVGVPIVSLIVGVFLIALIPFLMFLARFFLFRFFKITETKFRLIYASVSTIGVLVALAALWALAIVILSNFFPNI